MNSVVIVAAGKGTRMGPDVDKIFLELAGAPVLAHTWRAFDYSPEVHEIILVARAGLEPAFHELAQQFHFVKPHRVVAGGAERQDSVWHGLQAVHPAAELVAIHDAARPCVTQELIADTFRAARSSGAAVAAQRVTDTIKQSQDGGRISGHLDRALLWAVQTPQTFRLEVIRRALRAARESGLNLTDDTAACELIGQPVALVNSPAPNPKVTQPADLPWIGQLLEEMSGARRS